MTTSTPDTPGAPPAGDHYYDARGTVTVWDEAHHQWVRGAIVPEGSAPRPRAVGPRPSRTAQALAALVAAALGVLALSGIAALTVLVWRAVL